MQEYDHTIMQSCNHPKYSGTMQSCNHPKYGSHATIHYSIIPVFHYSNILSFQHSLTPFFVFLSLFFFFKTSAQNADTVLANNYLSKADSFSYIGIYDSSIFYYKKAGWIYLILAKEIDIAIQKHETETGRIGESEKMDYKINQQITDSPIHSITDSIKNSGEALWANYVKCLNGLGWNLGYIMGEYEQGLTYLKDALNIGINKLGEEHWLVAKSYNTLGVINANKDEAMKFFNKAASILIKLYGENHQTIAAIYNNIGVLFEQEEDYFTALEYHQQSLSIRLKIFNLQHLDVAESYENLGIIYLYIGEYEKAIICCNKALSIRKEILGEHHLAIAYSYTNIGNYYAETGDLDKALEFYNKALTIDMDVIGEEHIEVARYDLNLIGEIFFEKGDHLKALEYYKRSLNILRKALGEKHPYIGETYQLFGIVYESINNYDTALKYYHKAIVSLIDEFNNFSIYSNPKTALLEKRKAKNSKPLLLEAFLGKAEGFEKRWLLNE